MYRDPGVESPPSWLKLIASTVLSALWDRNSVCLFPFVYSFIKRKSLTLIYLLNYKLMNTLQKEYNAMQACFLSFSLLMLSALARLNSLTRTKICGSNLIHKLPAMITSHQKDGAEETSDSFLQHPLEYSLQSLI